jgi:hemerythrin superfamily protein
MSNASLQVETLGMLVERLVNEHKDFTLQTYGLDQSIKDAKTFDRIVEIFVPLKDALVEHMLIEETEIFPEVSRRGLFSERVSEIMQQHIDITATLDKMKFALHRKDLDNLQQGFRDLSALIKAHFPAEEKEVFPIVM